ncbi:MAG: hypothetical protein HY906_22950 [Deltaproteobacteria bacterium]|nr:hypothetical protein [Deltaproteobacteria bacterium]
MSSRWLTVACAAVVAACWGCGTSLQADGGLDGGGDAGAADAGAGATPYVLGFGGLGNLPKREPAKAQAFLDAMGYASEGAYYDDVVARARALGAPMVRGHMYYTGNGTFVVEEIVPRVETAGDFEVYGWVNPIPPFEAADAAFEAALDALVRAHPGIRDWQLGNEPDLMWNQATAATNYPAFFVRGQQVVRAACPDCRILLAGISNQYDSSSINFQVFEGFLDAIVAAGLPTRPFDVFDMHYYPSAPTREAITGAAAAYRGMVESRGISGVDYWSTETGLYTGDPTAPGMDPRTEEDQARDLARMVAWMGEAGVRRIYWWTLIEEWGGFSDFFQNMGLVYNGLGEEASASPPIAAGTRKKAHTTYELLAKALRDVSGASRPAAGVYRFERAQGPVYVVFAEDGVTSVTLDGLASAQVQVQVLVPDAQGQTPTTTLDVTARTVAMEVDATPRLVTPAP